MNRTFTASAIAILVNLCSISFAVDVFNGQPNIQGAYNKLTAALTELERSRIGDAPKHINEAVINLSAARTFLEQATNNKGTYLPAARKLIEEAKQELTATPSNAAHIDKGIELTRKALKETNKAGHAGAGH